MLEEVLLNNYNKILNYNQNEIIDSYISQYITYAEIIKNYSEVPIYSQEHYDDFSITGKRDLFEKDMTDISDYILKLSIGHMCGMESSEKLKECVETLCEYDEWKLPAHHMYGMDFNIPKMAATLAVAVLSGGLSEETVTLIRDICEDRLFSLIRDDTFLTNEKWFGDENVSGSKITNWTVWIATNTLFAASVLIQDNEVRKKVYGVCGLLLDRFRDVQRHSGWCDSLTYWVVSAGCYIDGLLLIKDITGEDVLSEEDWLINSVKAPYSIVVDKGNSIPLSDSTGGSMTSFKWYNNIIKELLLVSDTSYDSELMELYAWSSQSTSNHSTIYDVRFPYRTLYMLTKNMDKIKYSPDPSIKTIFYEEPQIYVYREDNNRINNKGFTVCVKGGKNDENHNHNDLGEVVIYLDGNPMFLDLGSAVYTNKMNHARYHIQPNMANFHNTIKIGNHYQLSGGNYFTETIFNDEHFIQMDLSKAYPYIEEGLVSYTRSVYPSEYILVSDRLEMEEDTPIKFIWITKDQPVVNDDRSITVGRIKMETNFQYEEDIEPIICEELELKSLYNRFKVPTLYRMRLNTVAKKGVMLFETMFFKNKFNI